jgi:hypothetical protein
VPEVFDARWPASFPGLLIARLPLLMNWLRVSAPSNTSGTRRINQRDSSIFTLLHVWALERRGKTNAMNSHSKSWTGTGVAVRPYLSWCSSSGGPCGTTQFRRRSPVLSNTTIFYRHCKNSQPDISDANATLADDEYTAALNSVYLFFGDVMTTSDAIQRLRPAVSRAGA